MQSQIANNSHTGPNELQQLTTDFARIDDPLARRALLDLVAAVAESEDAFAEPPKRSARKRRDKFRRPRAERPSRARARRRRS